MLWLQTHFDDEDWEELAQGMVDLESFDATQLSQDACAAGLYVKFPSPKTF